MGAPRRGCIAVVNDDDAVVREEAASLPPGVEAIPSAAGPTVRPQSVRSRTPARPPLWRISRDCIVGPGGFVLRWLGAAQVAARTTCRTRLPRWRWRWPAAQARKAAGKRRATTLVPAAPCATGRKKDGVAWYDDSKATTPAAVRAGVSGFSSVVLIAGGRNKGLDLSELASTVPPVRAVVAVGESADDVTKAFSGLATVRQAGSMGEAVEAALSLAVAGDAVVLSPGCASFDWYSSYIERGEVFSALVKASSAQNWTGPRTVRLDSGAVASLARLSARGPGGWSIRFG